MANKKSHILKSYFRRKKSCQNHRSFSIPRVTSEFGYYWCYDPRVTSKRLFSPSWGTLSIQFPLNQSMNHKVPSKWSHHKSFPFDTYFTPVKSSFVTKPCPNSTRSASPASQCTLLSSAASFPISPRCLAHKSVKKSFGIANVPTWGCPTLNLEHKCHRSTFTENRHHATAILTRLPCEYTASATRICCQNQSQASAIHLSEKKWGSKIFKWGYTREGFSLSTTGKGGS